jgi:hypothetical protein
LSALETLGLNKTYFGLHSLRSGGATAAAAAKVDDKFFKKHGRYVCLTYPSLALSVFQRPCFLKNLSSTFAAAAAVAPPDLRLCSPKYVLLRPKVYL